MESEIIVDVVMRLVGNVYPVADTTVDAERKENLNKLISVVGELMGEIFKVASISESYSRFASVEETKDIAVHYLKELSEDIREVVE